MRLLNIPCAISHSAPLYGRGTGHGCRWCRCTTWRGRAWVEKGGFVWLSKAPQHPYISLCPQSRLIQMAGRQAEAAGGVRL